MPDGFVYRLLNESKTSSSHAASEDLRTRVQEYIDKSPYDTSSSRQMESVRATEQRIPSGNEAPPPTPVPFEQSELSQRATSALDDQHRRQSTIEMISPRKEGSAAKGCRYRKMCKSDK